MSANKTIDDAAADRIATTPILSTAEIDIAAKALRAAAESFSSPVHMYVDGEAARRWRDANPDNDDCPFDAMGDIEDWRILVCDAMVEAVRAERERCGRIADRERTISLQPLGSSDYSDGERLGRAASADRIAKMIRGKNPRS